MNTLARPIPKVRPVYTDSYPESDGKPMADNTLQYLWNSIIMWNLEHQFATRDDVFVAGDNLVYPVEGDITICQAPDVYVAFGRPKGYRGSYKVFEEGGVFPQVVFEVWSPRNTPGEMEKKRLWYEKYGAEEFYLIYPFKPPMAQGWWRSEGKLMPIPESNEFVSPRLGVRFHFTNDAVALYGPDGKSFRSPAEIAAAEADMQRKADAATQRADALAAKLRALGVDPDA